jgi:hypothetical protein
MPRSYQVTPASSDAAGDTIRNWSAKRDRQL